MTCTILYRPIGREELKLIARTGFRAFPPRLPEQPIFYPVTNEGYAIEIAQKWNTRHSGHEGFVTRFHVQTAFLDCYERQVVGGKQHEEYWIPAEDLETFNMNIVGKIEVIHTFVVPKREN